MKLEDFIKQFEPEEGWSMEENITVEQAIAEDIRDIVVSAQEYWEPYGYDVDELLEGHQLVAETYIQGDESVRITGKYKVTITVEKIEE